MLLRVRVPVESGNKGISSGKLPEILQQVLGQLKPEAAYFTTDGGQRGAFIVFDMQDASQIPSIAEPLFQGLDAEIELSPVMTQDDLQKGLQSLQQG